MADHRKKVFQDKVLKKLFAFGEDEEDGDADSGTRPDLFTEESPASASRGQQNSISIPPKLSVDGSSRKEYTVASPPEGFKLEDSEIVEPEFQGSESSSDKESEGGSHSRRVRKRKSKSSLSSDLLRDKLPKTMTSKSNIQNSALEKDTLTKNQKRKLKKKRHREKVKALDSSVKEFVYDDSSSKGDQ